MKSLLFRLYTYLRTKVATYANRDRLKAELVQVASPELNEPTAKPPIRMMAELIKRRLEENVYGTIVEIGPRPGGHKLFIRGSIRARVDLIFGAGVVDISDVEVDINMRRRGLCRHFLQQLHNAIEAVGFQKMTLYAIFDGRVVWAALGFRPTPEAWRLKKQRFIGGYSALRHTYPSETSSLIDYLIQHDDVDVFPILANVKNVDEKILLYLETSSIILCNIDGWNGEFNVGDNQYKRFLFEGESN